MSPLTRFMNEGFVLCYKHFIPTGFFICNRASCFTLLLIATASAILPPPPSSSRTSFPRSSSPRCPNALSLLLVCRFLFSFCCFLFALPSRACTLPNDNPPNAISSLPVRQFLALLRDRPRLGQIHFARDRRQLMRTNREANNDL